MTKLQKKETHSSAKTVVQKTADTIRYELLSECKPGDVLPSLRSLCKTYNISINTAGAAINILVALGLLTKRHGAGIFMAERSVDRRIGILSELDLFDSRISHSFRSQAKALRDTLEKKGYNPCIYMGRAELDVATENPTCPEFWTDIESGKIEGAVILDCPLLPAWKERVANCPVPIVGCLCSCNVEYDLDEVVSTAVESLVDKGCHKIGLLARNSDRGFREAVLKCGVQTRDYWIGNSTSHSDLNLVDSFFKRILAYPERPDGLVIPDDVLFFEAQTRIMELGIKVPEELQLAILINRGECNPIRIPVTVFEIDPEESARQLADLLIQVINNRKSNPPGRIAPFTQYDLAGEFSGKAASDTWHSEPLLVSKS